MNIIQPIRTYVFFCSVHFRIWFLLYSRTMFIQITFLFIHLSSIIDIIAYFNSKRKKYISNYTT